MKLAIVDHLGNPGGGSRYLRALVPHLLKLRPSLQITFFGNPEAILRENLREEWGSFNIKIKQLSSLWLLNKGICGIKGTKLLLHLIHQRYTKYLSWLPYFLSLSIHRELELKINKYDLAFFPWPYFISFPKLPCPSVGVFHDFNFRYRFAGLGFSENNLSNLFENIPIWLEKSIPIVSTNFIKNEIKKFYPQFAQKTKVIHLAPMSSLSTLDGCKARSLVDHLGIPTEYILCPTNISPHKNLGPLFSAFYYLKERGYKIPLVLAGYGTENIFGKTYEYGIERTRDDKEVIGLGYVSNIQIDALIQCARAVISTSLYEAGNGPGLDAWGKGVPVAMSNIPSFYEHVEVQGVKAKLFDPRSPQDIADKIEEILMNPEQTKTDVIASLGAISQWTWELTAKKYLEVFDEAVHARV